ncbi:ABC transporter permease [Microbacterium hydrocarbonoxydans]|uniref:ABC transporter permease n=1 Tax=Microbacterium hydrocarbonoxydans TaxID=273678 RepID=UPI0007BC80BE|nr:ABC transporter permease [Microbacterium hydrocarbonoxydans]GAT74025.1 putrescine ABC transporter, permease protein PotI [Microbacterium sp. HM58-2]
MTAADTRAIVTARSTTRPKSPRSRGDLGFLIWGIAVLVFLFLPIAVVVAYSFNTGRLLTSFTDAGLDSFAAIVTNDVIRGAVLVSVQTGFIAAILASILGTLAGIAMARNPGKWVWWFLALLLLVSVTPEIVDAVALLPWLVTLGQDWGIGLFGNGIVRLVVGHSLFSVAIVSYLVRARLLGLDAQLEEASADLYAPPLTTFRRVTLPLAMPAVLAGFLLSFTLSLDNTVIAAFVSVAGTTPWPVYILGAVRTGLRPEIAAVSTIMLLLTLVALALVALVLKRAGDSAADIARTMAGG